MNYLEWINEKGDDFVPSRGERNYEDYLASLGDYDVRMLLNEQAEAFREFAFIVEEHPDADLREDGYGNMELFFGFIYYLTKRVYPNGLTNDEILSTSWHIYYSDEKKMLQYVASNMMLIAEEKNIPVATGFMAAVVAECAAESINEMMSAEEVDNMQVFNARILLLNHNSALHASCFLHDVDSFYSRYTETRKKLWKSGNKTTYSVIKPADKQFYKDLYQEEISYTDCHLLAEYLPEEIVNKLESYRDDYLYYLRYKFNVTDELSLSPLVGLNDAQTAYAVSLLKEAAKHKTPLTDVCNVLIAIRQREHLVGKSIDILYWLRDVAGIDYTDRSHSKQFAEMYSGDNISQRSEQKIKALLLLLKKKGF